MHGRVPLSPLAASPLNMTPTSRTPPSAAATHHYELCHANAEAIQVPPPCILQAPEYIYDCSQNIFPDYSPTFLFSYHC